MAWLRNYIHLFVFCTVTKDLESTETLRPLQENGIRYDVGVCNEFEVELVFELEGQEIGANDGKQVNVFHYEDDNQQLKHQLSSNLPECHHGYCIDLVYHGNLMNVTFKIYHVTPMDHGDYKVEVRLVGGENNMIFAEGSGTFEILVEEGDQRDKLTRDCIGDKRDKTPLPASKGTERLKSTSAAALTANESRRVNSVSSTAPTPTNTVQFKSILSELLAMVAFIFCFTIGVITFLHCKRIRRSEQTMIGENSDVSRLVAIFTDGGHVTGHVQMSVAMQSNTASTWV